MSALLWEIKISKVENKMHLDELRNHTEEEF